MTNISELEEWLTKPPKQAKVEKKAKNKLKTNMLALGLFTLIIASLLLFLNEPQTETSNIKVDYATLKAEAQLDAEKAKKKLEIAELEQETLDSMMRKEELQESLDNLTIEDLNFLLETPIDNAPEVSEEVVLSDISGNADEVKKD